MLPREVVHLPFEPGPFRMAMGLSGRSMAELIELDDKYLTEMAQRRQLLERRHEEVFAALPETEAARSELLALVADVLTSRFCQWFSREGDSLHNRLTGECWSLAAPACDPLELAGRLVQEDLCVLRLCEGMPVLIAGLVCFPSGWRLRDKLGQNLTAVHAPVPFYEDRLAGTVDRLMARLKPGRLAVRLNWGVVLGGELHRLPPTTVHAGLRAVDAGEQLFLRVERQTLSALPTSGAVLFGIRVHCYPLCSIAARPEIAARLAAAVRALPHAMRRYKEIAPFEQALLAYLDSRSDAPGIKV
jgi:dimethylamine monooxygenase subunit A